jgi:hypothetical protein
MAARRVPRSATGPVAERGCGRSPAASSSEAPQNGHDRVAMSADALSDRSVGGAHAARRRAKMRDEVGRIDHLEGVAVATTRDEETGRHTESEGQSHGAGMYLRFAAMILTAMVAMYWLMFVSSWELSHVRWSESRLFMTLTMGGSMGLIMLAWMLNMYRNTKANLIVVAVSILLLVVGITLDRSQVTVEDSSFMRAMIPHHSMAITRSERSQLEDVRVCELAVEISEAQRREIFEMDWLIDDIAENGVAATADEAQARPVPAYEEAADRECPSG